VVGYGRVLVSWVDATVLTEDGEVALRTVPVPDLVGAALAVNEDSRPEYTVPTFWVSWAVRLSTEGTAVIVPHDARPFRVPAATLLLDLATTETVEAVQQAIATALGHLADPRAVELLGRWRTHPYVQLRWSVCFALTPFAADIDALRYLVELTTDPDPRVRDWACFGLCQPVRTPQTFGMP
jgi:hypothetical protein